MKLSGIGTPLLSVSRHAFLLLSVPPRLSRADVGTAAHYSPPHTPTACFGNDQAQFPLSKFFAAAGEGIWDNGASCGRQYLVRCISASVSGTCFPSKTIEVRVVDRALSSSSCPSSNGATIVLSTTAFGAIANPSARGCQRRVPTGLKGTWTFELVNEFTSQMIGKFLSASAKCSKLHLDG